MNKTKRNRLKNKEKIKKLQLKINGLTANPLVTEVIVPDIESKKEVLLLKREIQGLHRFISRADMSLNVLTQSFNTSGDILISQLSDGALTKQALETIRFKKYPFQGNRDEPLYMIGLTPNDDISKDLQISFHLSRDLIRDVPTELLVSRHLVPLLKARKTEILKRV